MSLIDTTKKEEALTMYKTQNNCTPKISFGWFVLLALLFAILPAGSPAVQADRAILFVPEMLEYVYTREEVLTSWEDEASEDLDLWKIMGSLGVPTTPLQKALEYRACSNDGMVEVPSLDLDVQKRQIFSSDAIAKLVSSPDIYGFQSPRYYYGSSGEIITIPGEITMFCIVRCARNDWHLPPEEQASIYYGPFPRYIHFIEGLDMTKICVGARNGADGINISSDLFSCKINQANRRATIEQVHPNKPSISPSIAMGIFYIIAYYGPIPETFRDMQRRDGKGPVVPPDYDWSTPTPTPTTEQPPETTGPETEEPTFSPTPEPTDDMTTQPADTLPPISVTPGDANCDGEVNIADILFVRDVIFGDEELSPKGRVNLQMAEDKDATIEQILYIRDVIFGEPLCALQTHA